MVRDDRADLDVIGEWRKDAKGRWVVILPVRCVATLGQPGVKHPTALVRKRRGGYDLVTVWSRGYEFYAPERGEDMTYCYPSARKAA